MRQCRTEFIPLNNASNQSRRQRREPVSTSGLFTCPAGAESLSPPAVGSVTISNTNRSFLNLPFLALENPAMRFLLPLIALFGLFSPSVTFAENETRSPNVVLIFIDDMGYADIGPFGAKGYETPHLNRMAEEGRKFTNFIVPSAVCSASRSALMTGCIPERIGFRGALHPTAEIGISDKETTIAEVCKTKGYATACFGKWHLGHHPQFLPTQHGFDRYYGLPYSNDMWPYSPVIRARQAANPNQPPYPNLPLIENETVIDNDVTAEDQKKLTRDYTLQAVKFIRENAANPFFVYLPHSMVHVPLFSSSDFEGKHESGPFADAVTEVDWSVGQILKTLDELKLSENTLVIFTSDNGPWLNHGTHAGSAGPLREGKGTSWEGGIRVPTIMRWPGRIPAGTTTNAMASTIDVLPTVASLIGASQPELPIDGKVISPLLFEPSPERGPERTIPIYFANGQLQALRSDRWKLVFPHTYRALAGQATKNDGSAIPYANGKVTETELYDLDSDVGESKNVINDHQEVVAKLEKEATHWRTELGDSLQKVQGNLVRPAGKVGK